MRRALPSSLPTRCVAACAVSLACLGCGDVLDLGFNDGGVPYDASCVPGVYAGTYSCNTTSSSPLALSGNGPFRIQLLPSGAQTLQVAPDASLSSTMAGTTFTSRLTGTLDCPTNVLSGSVSQVVVSSATFKGQIAGTGTLSAVYEVEAGVPTLAGGMLAPPPTLATMCTWSAQLE